MSLDLSVLLYVNKAEGLEDRIQNILSELNAEGLSHELILICSDGETAVWEELLHLAEEYLAIRPYRIQFSNGFQGMCLAGAMQATGNYLVILDPRIAFPSRSIITLWHAIDKSNCQLIYGLTRGPDYNFIKSIPARIARWATSILSGLSSRASDFKIVETASLSKLKAKTPYFFHFDLLYRSEVQNHSYLYFKTTDKKKALRSTGLFSIWRHRFMYPIAWTVLPEIFVLFLIAVNIYLLLEGQLLNSLIFGLSAIAILTGIYLIKWRRHIAYKVIGKQLL